MGAYIVTATSLGARIANFLLDIHLGFRNMLNSAALGRKQIKKAKERKSRQTSNRRTQLQFVQPKVADIMAEGCESVQECILTKLSTLLPLSATLRLEGFTFPIVLKACFYRRDKLSWIFVLGSKQFASSHFHTDFIHLYAQISNLCLGEKVHFIRQSFNELVTVDNITLKHFFKGLNTVNENPDVEAVMKTLLCCFKNLPLLNATGKIELLNKKQISQILKWSRFHKLDDYGNCYTLRRKTNCSCKLKLNKMVQQLNVATHLNLVKICINYIPDLHE